MNPAWRDIQKQNFTNWEELLDYLELDLEKRLRILSAPSFALNLPKRLAAKIAKNSLTDPIFKQFVPTVSEKIETEGFSLSPLMDERFRKEKKLVHKYKGRMLLVTTSACAMNCRFCFRQNFPYETQIKDFNAELKMIANDSSITEIILSGGDPLSLSNATLKELIQNLSAIPHLQRIRFHTRFPIGIPERIDAEFLNILATSKLSIVFVVHVNCAEELDNDVIAALKSIHRLGIPVLSQSVLLKDINDSFEALKRLFERLINHGIIPYYLYQFDKVQGRAHFEVEERVGAQLIEELKAALPGYAVPKYVKEIPGQACKTAILPSETSLFASV